MAEIDKRDNRLDKREKDKHLHLATYQNLMLKCHAGDLFEIEKGLEDVLDLANITCLDQMEQGTMLGHVSVESLIPLFQLLGHLYFDVDTMVHNLQSCCTSKVGYKSMREHINREVEGNPAFSGSRSNRDYWTALNTFHEKSIIQTAAHSKALKALGGQQSGGSQAQGTSQGTSKAHTPAQQAKRQVRNAKNRKAANA